MAQSVATPTPLERAAGESTVQKYDGVVPSSTAKNPLPIAPQGGAYLVWTGFQMTSTGSQVFLQTTHPVEFDTGKSSKSAVSIVLRGCRIHMANNRRKIDTRYFATPVSSVLAKQKGRDVDVRIALREPVSAEPRIQSGPDGTQFVVLDFPPGKAAPESGASQDLAPGAAMSDGNGTLNDDGSESAASKAGGAGKVGAKAAARSSR
jgi:hypothetical protein